MQPIKLIIIASTSNTPMVTLDPEGNIVIQGRSYIEDATLFYVPVVEWIKSLTAQKLSVEIRLEYLNKSSSTQIYVILISIKENEKIEEVLIKWFYEEDDEEMLDLGKDYESKTALPFKFYEYCEHFN